MDCLLKQRLMKIVHLIVSGDIEISDEVLLDKVLSHIEKLKRDVNYLTLEEMNSGQLIRKLISSEAESSCKSFGIKFINIGLKFSCSLSEETLTDVRTLLDHWSESSTLQQDASFCGAILEMLLTIAQNELFIESLLSKECIEVSINCLQSKNVYIKTAAQNFLACIISNTTNKEKITKFSKISVISKETMSSFLEHLMENTPDDLLWRRTTQILLPIIKGVCLQNKEIAEDLRLPLLKLLSHDDRSIQSAICEIYAIILASLSPKEQNINEFIRLVDNQLLIQKFSGCMLLRLEDSHRNVSKHLQSLILLPLQSKALSLKDVASAVENLKNYLVVLADDEIKERAVFQLCRVLEGSLNDDSSPFGMQRLHVALLECFLQIIKNNWEINSERGHQLTKLLLLTLENRNIQGLILTKSLTILGQLIKRNIWIERENEPTGAIENNSLYNFGLCLTSFLCHPDWEIRDSTVELIGHLAEVTQDDKINLSKTFKEIETMLLQNHFPQMIWEQLAYELESFVRSSVLSTLVAFSEVPAIWNSLVDKYSKEVIIFRILRLLQEDSEEIVRRSACKLLSCWFIRDDMNFYQKSIKVAMQQAMKDFDWEVKLEALEFWKRIFVHLQDSYGLNNAFKEKNYPFSKEEKGNFERLLDELNREGFCFSILQAIDDCDICVRLKAVQILHVIKKGLSRSDLLTDREKYETPSLNDKTEKEETVDELLPFVPVPFNHEVVESILRTPDRDTVESLMVKRKNTEEKDKIHPFQINIVKIDRELFLEKLFHLDVDSVEKELQKSTDLHETTLHVTVLVSFLTFPEASSQLLRFGTAGTGSAGQCDCMEYWDCTLKGGSPEGYCDPFETSVCCFLPPNAKPVGLLPLVKAKAAACGTKGTDTGKENQAELGEWSWQAAILERGNNLFICGGSLLDERWVLTAAHCVKDYSISGKLKVRLGEYDVSIPSKGLPYEEFGIIRVVLHPDFNDTLLINDIALLKLDRRVKKRPHINIVCLPPNGHPLEFVLNSKCYVTGWGRTREDSNYSVVLKEIPVPVWKHEDCQGVLRNYFGNNYVLSPTMLCAGANGNDACDGDGGGPLVCEDGGIWHQYGVVSFGLGCSKPGVPGIYSYVPAFSGWIKTTVRQYS